ncbi:MAG TPA: hypothetical protein VK487_10930 [Candidatus Bathyarchaeia archaeon]|nr:hypothetical protein [Candidatus Bathyarchaeia archaeon]
MSWHRYYLGETISKTTEPSRLLETEEGIVETARDTLAIPVMLNGSLEGYVYHGHGKLVLDTLIETEQGTVGKPVEKEINKPFLMLGNVEKAQQQLSPASQENLSEMGYTEQKEFISSAEDLLNRFSGGERVLGYRHSSDGLVFAFQNEASKLDFLIAKGEKLVYKAMNTVFLSNRGRVVLKSSGGFICINNGKSVIVKR